MHYSLVIKKLYPRSPGCRFRSILLLKFRTRLRYATVYKYMRTKHAGYSCRKRKLLIHLRSIRPRVKVKTNLKIPNSLYSVIKRYFYVPYCEKEYSLSQTAYNHQLIIPSITTSLPGKLYKVYNPLDWMFSYKAITNSFISVVTIPYNLNVCNLFNRKQTHCAYVKSVGCSAVRVEAQKKLKLELVILPSGSKLYVTADTLCLLGTITDNVFRFIPLGKYFNK